MAYETTDWKDYETGGTLINAQRLNKAEAGIAAAHATADQAAQDVIALTNRADALNEEVDKITDKLNTTVGDLTGIEYLATMLDMKAGSATLAVASDSTANDGNDWVRLWLTLEAGRRDADLRIEYERWNPTAQSYDETIIRGGKGSPASGGKVLSDSFARTATDVVGTAAATGQTWQGTAGVWSANGATAQASGVGQLRADAGARDGKIVVVYTLTTSKPAAAQSHRIYFGSPASSLGSGLWLNVTVTTLGAVTVQLWKTIGATTAKIADVGDFSTLGLTINSATPQLLTVTLDLAIQNVTVTAAGTKTVTATAQLTEAEYGTLGTGRGIFSQGNSSQLAVDAIEFHTPYTPASYRTLRVLNTAVGGASLEYQRTRISRMYNERVDVLVMATGHNYGTTDPGAFIAAVEKFVADYSAFRPETLLAVSSQNPQFTPAATPDAHFKRQVAFRLLARRRGWHYTPAMEAFMAQPDGGQSLVGPDGVHPTTPPSIDPVDGYGASLWAKTFAQQIEDGAKL